MQLARNPLAARRARTLLGSRPCRPHGYGCQQSGGVYTALRSPNRKSGSRGLLSGRFILEAGIGFASRLYQPISRWHRRRVGRPRTSLRFSRPPGMRSRPLFTPAEATEIEAMASQIIPSNSTPGARSRRYLFHRPRARNFRSREARSLQERPGGPAEEDGGPPIQHWNVLRAIIDAPRQIELLKNIEKTEFFEQVRLHTIMGFLANPEYGGNRDRIGWKLMALETASSTSRPSASTTATTNPKRTDRGRDGDEHPEI